MHIPTIFCTTCGRYLGAAAACIFCGWERPTALHIPTTGAPLWRLPTTAPADGQPLLVGDTLLLADRSGALTAVVAEDGTTRWHWSGDGPLRGVLAAQGERIYAARRDGDLLAFDLKDKDVGEVALLPPLPRSANRRRGPHLRRQRRRDRHCADRCG